MGTLSRSKSSRLFGELHDTETMSMALDPHLSYQREQMKFGCDGYMVFQISMKK